VTAALPCHLVSVSSLLVVRFSLDPEIEIGRQVLCEMRITPQIVVRSRRVKKRREYAPLDSDWGCNGNRLSVIRARSGKNDGAVEEWFNFSYLLFIVIQLKIPPYSDFQSGVK